MTVIRQPVIEVEQPIGTFYLTSLRASDFIQRVRYKPRKSTSGRVDDVQRVLSKRRIGEISQYTLDPDATFPTPIILACGSEMVSIRDGFVEIPDGDTEIGDVIDGQHRLQGLLASGNAARFVLPVVLMFDLTAEEKAYVFSIINSKQTPVPASLIFDLFELSDSRSPAKTCHDIARVLNSLDTSPFYRGLKMLGRREGDSTWDQFLSQGSFVKYLLELISKNPAQDLIDEKRNVPLRDDPSCPLRRYYISREDQVIAKIVENYFSAVREEFPVEWTEKPRDFVLRKTVGYAALMRALRRVLKDAFEAGRADRSFFIECARTFRSNLGDIRLDSTNFSSSGAGATKLTNRLLGIDS